MNNKKISNCNARDERRDEDILQLITENMRKKNNVGKNHSKLFDISKMAIMKDSLNKLIRQEQYKLEMKTYVESSEEEDTSYFQKVLQKTYEVGLRTNYITTVCQNPESFFIEDIEELTYYDVADYFRMPLKIRTNDGKLINSDADKLNREEECENQKNCWAYREKHNNGGGYKIVLRKFRNYQCCLCCLREQTQNVFISNKMKRLNGEEDHLEIISCNQPHCYSTFSKPVIVDDRKYYNYAPNRDFMLIGNCKEPFMGIYGAFPTHNSERFLPYLINKNVICIDEVNEGKKKTFTALGIQEKSEVFCGANEYSLFGNRISSWNIEYSFDFPPALNHFLYLLESVLPENELVKTYLLLSSSKVDNKKFMRLCFDNNYKIPKTLRVKDYKNFDGEWAIVNSFRELNQDYREFCAQNEEYIRQNVFDIAATHFNNQNEQLDYVDYDSLFQSHSWNIYNNCKNSFVVNNSNHEKQFWDVFNVVDKEEEEDLFVYWKPRDADKKHVEVFFWFFVRINILLYLIKNQRQNPILQRYLKQIYLYSIPYIMLIEEFYFDRQFLENILLDYSNNFELEYEFSYENEIGDISNHPNKMKVNTKRSSSSSSTSSNSLPNLFEKLFASYNFDNICKKRRYKKITSSFGFVFDDTNKKKTTHSIFTILYRKRKKYDKELYSIIPLLHYLIKNDFPEDSHFNKDFLKVIRYYPRLLTKSKMFFDAFNPNYIYPPHLVEEYIFSNDSLKLEEIGKRLYSVLLIDMLPIYVSSLKPFKKNVMKLYKSNYYFAEYVTNAILCSVLGLYKWSNNSLIYSQIGMTKYIRLCLDFYNRFWGEYKKKIEYIEEVLLNNNYLNVILKENALYILQKNPELMKNLFSSNNDEVKKKKKKKKTRKLEPTISNFRNCVIKNGNSVRLKLFTTQRRMTFNNNNSTKKINKKKEFVNEIYNSFKSLSDELFIVYVMLNWKLPTQTQFNFVYDSQRMRDVFGCDWQDTIKKICKGWRKDGRNHSMYAKLIIDHFGKNHFTKMDNEIITKLFLSKKTNEMMMIIRDLSLNARSLMYYLLLLYIEKISVVTAHLLPSSERMYISLLNKYKDNSYLPFAVSNCCKIPHNSTKNYGYQNISLTLDSKNLDIIRYECTGHKSQKRKIPNDVKYEYFRNNSEDYIRRIVFSMGIFSNPEVLEHYKKIILHDNDVVVIIDKEEEEEEEEEEQHKNNKNRKRLLHVLNETQINNLKKKFEFLDSPSNDDDDDDDDDDNYDEIEEVIMFQWPKLKTRRECIEQILANVKMLNKFKTFLKKMCKWNRNLTDFKSKEIEFHDPVNYLFVIKKKGNKYQSYKLCLECNRVMEYNANLQFDMYNYCCSECQLETQEEEYKRSLVINSENEYLLAQISTS